MVHLLNKKIAFFLALFFIAGFAISQEAASETPVYDDYKDRTQHKNFSIIRRVVSEWQIHQLKNGALVVRLKTNQKVIDALLQRGEKRLAEKKRLEQLAININISRAYRYRYKFSALYFMYSFSSDTLLNGGRTNMFLDSMLVIDSSIIMKESFYLLAETDNIYNSSIGFVKEEEAKAQIEQGSETTVDALIVLKNKYGHQLKHPFPYRAYADPIHRYFFPVYENASPIIYDFYGGSGQKNRYIHIYDGTELKISILKDFIFSYYYMYAGNLNAILYKYYEKTEAPNLNEIDPKIKQFLY